MGRFRLFWFARTFSSFGDYIFSIALPWFALQQGGAWAVAGTVTTAVASKAIGSVLLAPAVNRFGSRRMLILTDFARGILMIPFAFLAWTRTPFSVWTLGIVAANAFFAGGFESGMQAYIPTISSALRAANADLSAGRSLVQLIGALTGGLLASWAPATGFLFNGFTFFVAGLSLFFIGGGEPVGTRGVRSSRGSWMTLWQNARNAVQKSPTLRRAFWLSLTISAATAPVGTMIAPLVQHAGGGGFAFGIVEAGVTVGGLVGALAIPRIRWSDIAVLLMGALLSGVSMLLLVVIPHLSVLILGMLLFGIALNVYNIAESTVIQHEPADLHAPVYGILALVSSAAYPLGALATAQLASLTTIRLPFAVGGVVAIAATAYLARFSKGGLKDEGRPSVPPALGPLATPAGPESAEVPTEL